MAISSLGNSSSLYSAFALKQANALAEQKAQQADSLRQSYEVAQRQADAAKQREQKLYADTTQAEKAASSAKKNVSDLQATQGQLTNESKQPEALFALYQSAKNTLTPYDITQKIVNKGSLVNTTA